MFYAMSASATPYLAQFVNPPPANIGDGDWLEPALLQLNEALCAASLSGPTNERTEGVKNAFDDFVQNVERMLQGSPLNSSHCDSFAVPDDSVLPDLSSTPPSTISEYAPDTATMPHTLAQNRWSGARYPESSSAGSSRIQSPQLHNARFFAQDTPMSSRATTPTVQYDSLPSSCASPALFDSASRSPASGPVRRQRRHRAANSERARAGLSVHMEDPEIGQPPAGPCPSAGNLSKTEVQELIKAAQAALEHDVGTVTCDWDGCTAVVTLRDLLPHLRNAHSVPSNGASRVDCRWGQCEQTLTPGALHKHVRSQVHLDLILTCPTCGKKCQRADVLKRHLDGKSRLLGELRM
ncbi:hypothetical protein B0H13DRAFT_2035025 [Mycena leptocephala]|nr:hypothetical protein B0H13DRAFT_2035025 [Mycena leptocephala]